MTNQLDTDKTVMLNAHEEALLWELLSDFRQKYPELSEAVAHAVLKERLAVLVTNNIVGMYRLECGKRYASSEDFPNLSEQEALEVISDSKCWLVPDSETTVLVHLWAKDSNYFG